MLDKARVGTCLPTQHLARARRFYAEKLGLEPTEERPGGLLLRVASGGFALYGSAGTAPGTFTQMAFEVDDLHTVVAELKRRGMVSRTSTCPAYGRPPSTSAPSTNSHEPLPVCHGQASVCAGDSPTPARDDTQSSARAPAPRLVPGEERVRPPTRACALPSQKPWPRASAGRVAAAPDQRARDWLAPRFGLA
jgi:catechol 2,3-dioxygenase-like lactoylglutathione lyase family enzyme